MGCGDHFGSLKLQPKSPALDGWQHMKYVLCRTNCKEEDLAHVDGVICARKMARQYIISYCSTNLFGKFGVCFLTCMVPVGHASKCGTNAKQLPKSENEESEEKKDFEDHSIMHILECLSREEQKMF